MSLTPEWYAERKICQHCGREFGRRDKESRRDWTERKNCSNICGVHYRAASVRKNKAESEWIPAGTVLDPAEAKTPGHRLRWLRLSASTCGRKRPMELQSIGDKIGLSRDIVSSLELGLTAKDAEKRYGLCLAAMGLTSPGQQKILTVSQEKFVRVVKEAGLIAKTLGIQKKS